MMRAFARDRQSDSLNVSVQEGDFIHQTVPFYLVMVLARPFALSLLLLEAVFQYE
jgi:hypothetical protein